MSEALLKVGCRVNVPAKGTKGTVQYLGTTAFQTGKWVGISLDEPKGKNNGTVGDRQYFKCEDNYGVFVRQNQLIILDKDDNPVLDLTDEGAATPKSKSTTKLSRRKSSPQTTQTTLKKPEKSSSRLSLASVTSSPSREDLSGSTSSLTSQPTSVSKRASSFVEKTPTSKLPKQIASTTKTSSKVPTPAQKQSKARRSLSHSKESVNDEQTGFVETLKPQFTPGQVMLSPAQPGPLGLTPGSTAGINMAGGSTNVSLLQQEIENLREQLKDLTEKYETLKVKRLQDKEKLKEFEKTRIQLDQMMEFKSKIMESQAALQRDLQLAKKEAKDAIEAKNLHAEEMSDLAETVEMATLDKEMAEEKAESLALELQEVKDKLEEVTLDYETLKAEIEGSGNIEGGSRNKTSYEFKQLEQQNTRLKETLVKMRDLVAHDKHEYQKLHKDLDQKKSEIAELSRTKEKLSTQVETLEEQVADLQEQVDAALGAEELVETLGNDKMTLQEKISQLEEEISDLEALKDTNDQLLEAQKEIDLELREELDMALNTVRETQREKDAALENLNDCQQTIQKFRELVSKLQEQLQDLQGRLEAESNKPVAIPEMVDFQKIFQETKAHKRAIDLELRQIDLNQRDQHVQFLTAFMPDSFMNRGGDHDAILLLLLMPRLLYKCDILLSQIGDKFPRVDKITRAAVVKEDKVVQFACRCRLSYYLYSCETVLHQFIFGLDTCSADTLLKAGSKYPEVAVQEKIIDSYIESAKTDKLDENILTEPLEKCLNYLEAMQGILFENSNKIHQSHLIRDLCQGLSAACDSVFVDCQAIQSLLSATDNSGEISLLTQFIAANLEMCISQLKNIRRKIPTGEANLNVSHTLLQKLNACCQGLNKLMKTIHEVVKHSRQYILLQGESDSGIPNSKLEEIFQSAVDKHLELEMDETKGSEAAKNIVVNIMKVVSEFNAIVDKTDFDLISPSTEKPPERPIVARATFVKKELDETKVLAKRLESKELDIRELKLALKGKQDELSEMCIRKNLIEKKLETINKDHEVEIGKLKSQLEEVKEALKKKEKDFEETMDHLQADIDALEIERGELKEKIKLYSRKPAADISPELETAADKATSPPGRLWTGGESDPSLLNQIQQLRTALKNVTLSHFKQECNIYRQKIIDLPPIPTYKSKVEEDQETKRALSELWKEGQELKKQVVDNLVFNLPDFTKVKPGEKMDASTFFTKEFERKKEIQNRVNLFTMKVTEQVIKLTKGGSVQTALKMFPTPEMRKLLAENEPIPIGHLTMPISDKDSKPEPPVVIDLQSLKQIQERIAYLVA